MEIEIKVISTDIITPSSSTPNHLHKHSLSYLDQMSPPIFMPLIIFYPPITILTNSDISNQLKKSLSQVLSQFYPLAGRLVDNSYINCNDEGVIYVEAQTNCKLFDVINHPIPGEFNKFIPCDLDDIRDLCMVVQTTFFSCGGFVLGIGMSHKLADGYSFIMLINSWAAISSGNNVNISPDFMSASTLFPPRDMSWYNAKIGMVKKEDIVTKIFRFNATKINELRDEYTKKGMGLEVGRRPTRIETLSTFLWTRFMVSTQVKDDRSKTYALVNGVNLRTRAVPRLPQSCFGNIQWPTITLPTFLDDQETFIDNQETALAIVEKVRESIRDVDGDYVNKLREGRGDLNFRKDRVKDFMKGKMVTFKCTSLCRFPVYEADFGWGKPMWIGSARIGFKNFVTFLDSLSGDGIEAWINMNWEDMAKFEADEVLLKYVSFGYDA